MKKLVLKEENTEKVSKLSQKMRLKISKAK